MAVAAGTVVQSIVTNRDLTMAVVTLYCTASVDDASFPATALNAEIQGKIFGHFLYAMETNPGTTSPTDNYDITLEDADGLDILGGAGADRDASATEKVMPKINGIEAPVPIDGPLTLKITNNSVNSAVISIKFYFVR